MGIDHTGDERSPSEDYEAIQKQIIAGTTTVPRQEERGGQVPGAQGQVPSIRS